MLKYALSAILITSLPAWADEPLKITGYPMSVVALYDAQGEFIGDLPRENLPKPEVQVLSFNEERNLIQIALSDRKVWLDPLDVKLNKGKAVFVDCRKVAETSVPRDKKQMAVMGYSESCAKK